MCNSKFASKGSEHKNMAMPDEAKYTHLGIEIKIQSFLSRKINSAQEKSYAPIDVKP
jgi:hypothetical protein